MSEANRAAANMLLRSARALAGYAAEELFQRYADLRESDRRGAFPRWQGLLKQSVEELAAAIASDRPQFFADHVRWAQSVLTSRGVGANIFTSALECLSDVLAAELPENSASLAVAVCRQAIQASASEPPAPPAPLDGNSVYGRLANGYLLAILEGDRRRATKLILNAAEAGHPVADLYLKVLLPVQEESGRMWQEDEINVAEEHFATATTRMIMAQLRQYVPAKPSTDKTLLSAAVAGNQHDTGLHAVAEFFEMDGWRVIQLGADVPMTDLLQAVKFYQPDLIALSASMRTQLSTLRETIAALRAEEGGSALKILIGGRAIAGADDLAAQYDADGYAADPAAAVALGGALVGLPSLPMQG
jgi:methanogenic corrinoid protein MtbC1